MLENKSAVCSRPILVLLLLGILCRRISLMLGLLFRLGCAQVM